MVLFACFGGERILPMVARERLERVIEEAGKIIGAPHQNFETVYTSLLMKKLDDVMEDSNHPLHQHLSAHLFPRSGLLFSYPPFF